VEHGWDPIPRQYAEQYAKAAWSEERSVVLERMRSLVGDFNGKKILDLGGGAGQYSVPMAQLGAMVTWHDVSREYQRIARRRAEEAGVPLQFSLGYLEAADKLGPERFDAVFCRLCWYYCRSDRRFARLIFRLLRPGGAAYIECNTPAFDKRSGIRRLLYWLNNSVSWKIGHPLPPHGRIATLMQRYPLQKLVLDYSSEFTDVVMFVKGGDGASKLATPPNGKNTASTG
jgi:SAM-dependent methyltransferase